MARKRRGRGEGSIFQRADGVWCSSISQGYTPKGKRRRKTVYGSSKSEVQDKLRSLQNQGLIVDVDRLTVEEFVNHWLATVVKPAAAPTTYARYEQLARLQVIPYLGRLRLNKFEPHHAEQWLESMERDGVSSSNRRKAAVMLHTAMRKAVRSRHIRSNPLSEVEKPRLQKTEMKVLNPEQVEALLKAAKSDRLEALYVAAVSTGMRQGELYGLQWGDIDFKGGSLSVQRTLEELSGQLRLKNPKSTKSRRRIDLPQFVLDVLNAHRARMLAEGLKDSHVFCAEDGSWLRRPNVSRRSFKPMLKAAGLPAIRFHDLRHTSATLLLLKGVHPKIVSERLGHASIEITLNTYSHVLPTLQREAADKLERLFG